MMGWICPCVGLKRFARVFGHNRYTLIKGIRQCEGLFGTTKTTREIPHAMLMPTNKLSNLTIFATKQTYRGSFNFVHCLV